jgi:hypothetical protein
MGQDQRTQTWTLSLGVLTGTVLWANAASCQSGSHPPEPRLWTSPKHHVNFPMWGSHTTKLWVVFGSETWGVDSWAEDKERWIEIKRIIRHSILGSHPLVAPGWNTTNVIRNCYSQKILVLVPQMEEFKQNTWMGWGRIATLRDGESLVC